MRDTFCILPWIHLQVNNEGTAMICCKARNCITTNGRPMSLHVDSLQDMWSSEYLREVRRKMAAGEAVEDCLSCYNIEQAIGHSYRTYSNERWLKDLGWTEQEVKERALAADYRPDGPLAFVQLNLGNLCNLKCRMCSSSYSLPIARDATHSQWAATLGDHAVPIARWEANKVALCPWLAAGVEYAGMLTLMHDRVPVRWTAQQARVGVPLPAGTKLRALRLHLRLPRPYVQYLVVRGNGKLLFRGLVAGARWSRTFDLEGMPTDEGFEVRLECPPWRRWLGRKVTGVGIEHLELERVAPPAQLDTLPDVVKTRFADSRDWHEQPQVLAELLDQAEHIRELYFTGGEPTIIPAVTQIIDRIIERGVAPKVALQFNTNCTRIREDFLDKLARFRKVQLTLSLDAVGRVLEYIRYPARWDSVAANVHRLARLKFAYLVACPVLQVYNVLNLVDLFRFCDALGIDCFIGELGGPPWLDVNILPAKVRALAAERLERYAATDCRPGAVEHVTLWARNLREMPDCCTPEVLRTFMLFTNDLDATRGQSFRASQPELWQLLAEAGVKWTDETRYAPRKAA